MFINFNMRIQMSKIATNGRNTTIIDTAACISTSMILTSIVKYAVDLNVVTQNIIDCLKRGITLITSHL